MQPIGSVGQSFGHKASGQGGPNGAVPGTGTGSSMVMRGQGMGSNIDTGGRASQTNAAAGGANSSGVGKGMFGGFNFPMERQDNA